MRFLASWWFGWQGELLTFLNYAQVKVGRPLVEQVWGEMQPFVSCTKFHISPHWFLSCLVIVTRALPYASKGDRPHCEGKAMCGTLWPAGGEVLVVQVNTKRAFTSGEWWVRANIILTSVLNWWAETFLQGRCSKHFKLGLLLSSWWGRFDIFIRLYVATLLLQT